MSCFPSTTTTPAADFGHRPAADGAIYVVDDDAALARELANALPARGGRLEGHGRPTGDVLTEILRLKPDVVVVQAWQPGGRELATEVCRRTDAALVLVADPDAPMRETASLERVISLTKPITRDLALTAVELALARRCVDELERTLREKEERLRTTESMARTGSWDWDIRSKRIVWSDEMCRLHGHDPGRFVPALESALALYPDGSRQAVPFNVERSLAPVGAESGIYRVHVDGEERFHWVSWKTLFDEGGPVRMTGVCQDITEYWQDRETLRMFRDALDRSSHGFHITDVHGRFVDANAAFCGLVGYTREELLARPVSDVFTRERSFDWERHFREFEEKSVLPFESECRTKDGRRVPVEVSPALSKTGVGQFNVTLVCDLSERRDADRALARERQRFEALFLDAHEAIYQTSVDGRIEDINLAFVRLLGYDSPEELRGKHVGILWADLEERGRIQCERSAASAIDDVEVRWKTKSGEPIDVVLSGRTLRDESGATIGYQGFAQRTDDRWRLFDDLPDGIVVVTATGSIRYCSRAFASMLGYDRAELLGVSLNKLIPERFRDAHVHAVEAFVARPAARAMASGRTLRAEHKDGTEISISVQLAKISRDCAIGVVRQDSFPQLFKEKERLAAELFQMTREIEDVYQIAGLGRWEYDFAKASIWWSDEQYLMGGIRAGTPVTRALLEAVVHREDWQRVRTAVDDALTDGHAELLFRIVRPDGEVRHIKGRGRLVVGADGRPAKVLGSTVDVTLSVEFAQVQEANRAKTYFLANMSHELRTPLNAVLGLSEALLERVYGELTEKQERSLRTINSGGRYLLELINDVLDVARVEAGKMAVDLSTVPLDPLVRECIALVEERARARHQSISCRAPTRPLAAHADRRRLKQILLNLLSNAIKFSPDGATVALELRAVGSRGVVEITVEDEGPGIPPADRARVFEPFERLEAPLTREQPGTGLGLALVHRLAGLQGGSVRVEDRSPKGGGSRFVLTLPIAHPPEAGEESSSDPKVPPSRRTSSKRILLVEDDEANVLTLLPYLEAKGYAVDVLGDGLSAVEAALAPKVALVLMDMRLPGIDGFEATRRIRAAEGPTSRPKPIIALTAFAMPEDERRCIQAGATRYFSKPLGLAELVQAIERLLSLGSAYPGGGTSE